MRKKRGHYLTYVTWKQLSAVIAMENFIEKNGRPPLVKEWFEEMGKPPDSRYYVKALRRKGLIIKVGKFYIPAWDWRERVRKINQEVWERRRKHGRPLGRPEKV